jgi:hypothetical protein
MSRVRLSETAGDLREAMKGALSLVKKYEENGHAPEEERTA